MPINVEIHEEVETKIGSFGISAKVRERMIETLLSDLQTIPASQLPIYVFAPVVLRSHAVAVPDGDTLHHFVFGMMTSSDSRRIIGVDYRVSGPDTLTQ